MRYRHYRFVDERGNILNNGGYTLAVMDQVISGVEISIGGLSRCARTDNFDRAVGRYYALNRLLEGAQEENNPCIWKALYGSEYHNDLALALVLASRTNFADEFQDLILEHY